MSNIANINLNYDKAIKIADGVYWIGFYDKESGLHCNPYLIIDGDEAVVVDGGSRPDFPTVMMKILQAGVVPPSITTLIYHHYDPDLCGSIPNFEDMIDNKNLRLISDKENHMFIRHYYVSYSKMYSLEDVNFEFRFASGRRLEFYKTPYCHSQGSFITFDTKSGVLFSSDIFGSYSIDWDLFFKLDDSCHKCTDYTNCPEGKTNCSITDLLSFHQVIMTSERALKYAVELMSKIPFKLIAPQHGGIIYDKKDFLLIFELLKNLKRVGIDRHLDSRAYTDLGDLSALKNRLESE